MVYNNNNKDDLKDLREKPSIKYILFNLVSSKCGTCFFFFYGIVGNGDSGKSGN